MKLTKIDKQAFVRAVMDDVPQVDHTALARAAAQLDAFNGMPAKVQEVYRNPVTRHYLNDCYISTPMYLGSVCILAREYFEPSLETTQRFNELAEQAREQMRARDALENKITAAITGCTTLKKAQETLPELAKYLPADRDGFGTANLPVTANLIADLMQAGWPKEIATAGSQNEHQ